MSTPNPIIGGLPNHVAEGLSEVVMSASSEANARTLVANLRNPASHRPWISASSSPIADASFQWHYGGASRSADHVGLFGVDLPFDSDFQLELFGGQTVDVGDPVYDSTRLPTWYPYFTPGAGGGTLPWGQFIWGGRAPQDVLQNFPRNILIPLLAADGLSLQPIQHASGRFTFRTANPVTSQTYWRVNYLDVSEAWMSSCPPAWGRERNGREWTLSERGPAGHFKSTARGYSPGHSFGFNSLTLTESLHRVERLNAAIGTVSPLVLILEPHHPENFWRDAGLYRLNSLIKASVQPRWRFGRPVWKTNKLQMEAWS